MIGLHTRIDIYFGIFIQTRTTYPYKRFSADGWKLQRGLIDSDNCINVGQSSGSSLFTVGAITMGIYFILSDG